MDVDRENKKDFVLANAMHKLKELCKTAMPPQFKLTIPKKSGVSLSLTFKGYRQRADVDPNYSQFLPPLSGFFIHHVESSVAVARDRGLKSLRSSTNKVTISTG